MHWGGPRMVRTGTHEAVTGQNNKMRTDQTYLVIVRQESILASRDLLPSQFKIIYKLTHSIPTSKYLHAETL